MTESQQILHGGFPHRRNSSEEDSSTEEFLHGGISPGRKSSMEESNPPGRKSSREEFLLGGFLGFPSSACFRSDFTRKTSFYFCVFRCLAEGPFSRKRPKYPENTPEVLFQESAEVPGKYSGSTFPASGDGFPAARKK